MYRQCVVMYNKLVTPQVRCFTLRHAMRAEHPFGLWLVKLVAAGYVVIRSRVAATLLSFKTQITAVTKLEQRVSI